MIHRVKFSLAELNFDKCPQSWIMQTPPVRNALAFIRNGNYDIDTHSSLQVVFYYVGQMTYIVCLQDEARLLNYPHLYPGLIFLGIQNAGQMRQTLRELLNCNIRLYDESAITI